MFDAVDREAIARAERRRQALEALEFERARAAALRERLETVVVELEGPALDEAAFAQMAPADVEVVRPALQAIDAEPDDPESEPEFEEVREAEIAMLEEEIARLDGEIASSSRRQQAFERYLDALGS
jgi:hypothetical protein